MDEELEKLTHVALSPNDIQKWCKGKANIKMYEDLNKYSNIDEVLNGYNHVFILLRSEPLFGHWMCIKRCEYPNGAYVYSHPKYGYPRKPCLSFFDPYGGYPDAQKSAINPLFLEESGQKTNSLLRLLFSASQKYYVEYSDHKIQKFAKNINTCGQWCCLFINWLHMSVDRFYSAYRKVPAEYRDKVCVANFNKIFTFPFQTY